VFPSDGAAGHLGDIKCAWSWVTGMAKIGRYEEHADARGRVRRQWTTDVRPHDLRHTFASMAAAASHSLPLIGRLLGQRRLSSTRRYTHFADTTLRVAANHVGEAVLRKRNRTSSGKQ